MKCVSGLHTVVVLTEVVSMKDLSSTPSEKPENLELVPSKISFLLTSTVVLAEDTMVQNSSNCGKILEYKHLNNNGGYFPEAC